MELKITLTTLSVFLFFYFTTTSAFQSSNHEGAVDDHQKASLHMLLPRKLMFNEAALVKDCEENKFVPQKKQMHDLSDNEKRHIRGTRQAWIQRGEKMNYEFFTMDYSRVRRRRPIHNKYRPTATP